MASTEPGVETLFRLLGNERRMAILRTLWDDLDIEAYMRDDQAPIGFAALREGAGIDDTGNFNYHLGELEGQFVEAVEDGYVLSPLGYSVLQAIEGYTSFSYWTIEPTPLDDPCPFCDGRLEAGYEREVVFVRCLDCDAQGDGSINRVRVPATGYETADLETLLDLSVVRLLTGFTASRAGICRSCYGPMDVDLVAHGSDSAELEPADSEPEESGPAEWGSGGSEPAGADTAGSDPAESATSVPDRDRRRTAVDRHRTTVGCRVRCQSCGNGGYGPLREYGLAAPSVRAFFDAHGIGPDDDLWGYRLAYLRTATETVRTTDPLTVEYAFELDGDTRRITVSEAPTGLDVEAVATDDGDAPDGGAG